MGDVVYDKSQDYFAVSAPRGNQVLIYSALGEFIHAIDVVDPCGLNATNQVEEFIVTSGTGSIIHLAKENAWQPQELAFHADNRWDNHLFLFE